MARYESEEDDDISEMEERKNKPVKKVEPQIVPVLRAISEADKFNILNEKLDYLISVVEKLK